jgi:ATP-binding cassette subfamily B multidrug efflux pump
MFRWMERQIDPFSPFDEGRTPPGTVGAFGWHYLKPVRGWLAVLFVASVAIGVFESSLYLMIGWLVDLIGSANPETIWSEHGTTLAALGIAILILRPILHFSHEAI